MMGVFASRVSRPRRLAVLGAALSTTVLVAGCGGAPSGTAAGGGTQQKDDYVIALSNSFLGNTWRQTMVEVFQYTAENAKNEGLISDYKVVNASENSASQQISQIKSLITQQVDAILIDSASATALNPVIKQACNAGIVVVAFDSLASAECAYKLVDELAAYGQAEAKIVAEAMGGDGNLLMVRGVVGSQPEKVIHDNQLEVLEQYPDIEIVGEVVGQASNSVTQQAVQSALPSLPDVEGVITGGSSLGAIKAFQNAGRPLPAVAFANTHEGLAFWKKLSENKDYTASSVRTEPGQAAAAFWEALAILDGQDMPKKVIFPILKIDQESLGEWLEVTPPGNVATWLWTREQTMNVIESQGEEPLPRPSVPDQAPSSG